MRRLSQKFFCLGWGGALLFWAATASANHIHMKAGPFLGVVLSVVVDPADPRTLYCAAYGGGVFKSSDGGASWTAMNQGLPDRSVFSLLVDPKKPRRLYLGADQGIFHSQDGGASWTLLALKGRNIRALALDPTEPSVLYAATDQGVFLGRGKKWTRLSRGLSNNDVRSLAVSARGEIFAGTFAGVFKRKKGGSAWAQVNRGLTERQVRVLALDPSSPDTLYAGTALGGVFKTTDGGREWQEFNRGLLSSSVLALAVAPDGAVYAGTVSGVFSSPSARDRWLPAGEELDFTVASITFDPKKPRLLYAGSGGRLFKSVDGGKKWVEVSHEVNHFGPGHLSKH